MLVLDNVIFKLLVTREDYCLPVRKAAIMFQEQGQNITEHLDVTKNKNHLVFTCNLSNFTLVLFSVGQNM